MMMITIHTLPTPQKQTRVCNGHFYDPSKKDKEALQWQLKAYAPKNPIRGPVEIFYSFYMPIPKGTSSIRKRQMIMGSLHHVKKPDVDNLAYIITNALKGIIIEDDSQIVKIHMEKLYGEEPKIVLKINDLTELREEENVAVSGEENGEFFSIENEERPKRKTTIFNLSSLRKPCVIA